jgi:hypothetical protein
MIHPTPTRTLLTTTFEPLVMQLSGWLARGTRLLDRCGHAEPTPETTMAFARELSDLLREVGRRIMAWTLNRLEPDADREAPARVLVAGRLYRRRRKHPHAVGTLCGPVTLGRRLYEPRGPRGRSMHPWERRLGIAAGLAPPALAARVGSWATDPTQHEVREIVQRDHGVSWSCTSLRKVMGSLHTGTAPYREGAPVTQVLSWIEQARASTGRFRPTLSVGRDGICAPLRGGVAPEGATATVAGLDRRGQRVGTAALGQRPASGQGTLTDQRSGLLQAMRSQGDSQLLRLVSVSDEGHHPSTYDHQVLKKMVDPRRPWRRLEWIRIVDVYHACGSVQPCADTIFGAGDEAQNGGPGDAPCAQDQGRWGRTRAEVGVGVASASGPVWPGQALPSSVSFHQNAHAVDAFPQLSAPAMAPRGWNHGGRLQGRLYAAPQTLGNVVDDRGWASDPGPTRDPVERYLGCGPSAVLGLETASSRMRRQGQGRSTSAISSIGGWEWSDHTRMDQYEVRKYPGWHHHRRTTMLVHFFLWHLKRRLGEKSSRADGVAVADIVGGHVTAADRDGGGRAGVVGI